MLAKLTDLAALSPGVLMSSPPGKLPGYFRRLEFFLTGAFLSSVSGELLVYFKVDGFLFNGDLILSFFLSNGYLGLSYFKLLLYLKIPRVIISFSSA